MQTVGTDPTYQSINLFTKKAHKLRDSFEYDPHLASIVHKDLIHYALFHFMAKISITLVKFVISISDTKTIACCLEPKKGGRPNVRDLATLVSCLCFA